MRKLALPIFMALLATHPPIANAQKTTSELAARSTLLGMALPHTPRRITGGLGFGEEAIQMNKGARAWDLGKCTKYELLYWTNTAKVKPSQAYSSFLAAAKTAGWGFTDVFSMDPLAAFVLTKGTRRVLGSLVLDRGPSLSLCELTR
jgi:hypothetical protein